MSHFDSTATPMTLHEAAAELSVSVRTIQRRVRAGELELAPDVRPRANLAPSFRAWYVVVFVAYNGSGPYPCTFCGLPVTMEELNVHHADHDHTNDDPANLEPAHVRCHMSHHHRHAAS